MESEKLNIRKFAVVFTILYSVMPFVSVAVSTYFTTYSYMVFCVLFLILIMMEEKAESINEYFTCALPFIFFGLLTFFVKIGSVAMWGYRQMLFVMPLIIGVYVINYHKDECALYSKVILLCIIITCVTTARGLQIYPGASRWLATDFESDNPMNITLTWMNIGGYNFVYTIVLLYPLVVLAYKRHKINIVTALIISAVAFFCLISAEFTIALIFFVATTTMFFIKRKLRASDLFAFVVITVLLMILFSTVMSDFIRMIADNIGSGSVSNRLHDIAGGLQGIERSDDNRYELYMRSVNTFLTHPLGTFISGSGGAGGHSFILDYIAKLGIIGLLMIISMYRKIYQLFYKKYEVEEDFGYIMWIFIQAVLLSTINTGMWVDVLAFYAPVGLSYLYKEPK